MNERKTVKGGRPHKLDPAKNCVMLRLNDVEYAKFLTLYERSGVYSKATFIKARVFNESFRVVTIDKTKYEYYQKLSEMHAQFRGIGINYNQIIRILRSNFEEKRAMSLLYRLEKQTIEMIIIQKQIAQLTDQFNIEWSQK